MGSICLQRDVGVNHQELSALLNSFLRPTQRLAECKQDPMTSPRAGENPAATCPLSSDEVPPTQPLHWKRRDPGSGSLDSEAILQDWLPHSFLWAPFVTAGANLGALNSLFRWVSVSDLCSTMCIAGPQCGRVLIYTAHWSKVQVE